MFEPGLGKERHIERATGATNPFQVKLPSDPDLQYTALALALFGPGIQQWREEQRAELERALAKLEPLRKELDHMKSATARAVAPDRDVAGLAFLTAILRWPDRAQARGYLEGFQVIGDIPTSKIFRQITPSCAGGPGQRFLWRSCGKRN